MRYRRNPRTYILHILLREQRRVIEIEVIAYTVREVIQTLERYERQEGFIGAFLEVEK